MQHEDDHLDLELTQDVVRFTRSTRPKAVKQRETRQVSGPQAKPKNRTSAEAIKILRRLREDGEFRRLKPRTKLAIYDALIAFGGGDNEWWTTHEAWAELSGVSRSTIQKVIEDAEGVIFEVIDQRYSSGPQRGQIAPSRYVLDPRFAESRDCTSTHEPWVPVQSTNSDTVKQNTTTKEIGLVGTGSQSSTSSPRTEDLNQQDKSSDRDYPCSHGSYEEGCSHAGCWNYDPTIRF